MKVFPFNVFRDLLQNSKGKKWKPLKFSGLDVQWMVAKFCQPLNHYNTEISGSTLILVVLVAVHNLSNRYRFISYPNYGPLDH